MHYYRLLETAGYPTLSIDGIRMHRTKDMKPEEDTKAKIRALNIRGGVVLDTCCGLGYTAIESAKYADKVVTVEKSPEVVEIAKQSSYSRELFNNGKITLVEGDVFNVIKEFSDEYFNYIVHDPPRLVFAGELYGGEFYRGLFRVLKPKGRMFHYIGSPGAKYRNRNIKKGVVRRLMDAGFMVEKRDNLLGLICIKNQALNRNNIF